MGDEEFELPEYIPMAPCARCGGKDTKDIPLYLQERCPDCMGTGMVFADGLDMAIYRLNNPDDIDKK